MDARLAQAGTRRGKVMERREEIRQLLRQRPFQPFRVRLSDGRTFDIHDPHMNMVTPWFFTIGIPEVGVGDPYPEHLERVDWPLIQTVEMLPSPTNAGG
jgi:hypothetical protein